MDPNVVITNPMNYLMSVGGIVALTITIVHVIKRDLGQVRILKDVPTWVYAVCVSAALTYTAHALLHTIEGELTSLLVQAVFQAFVASGVIETVRTWNKPIAETSTALDAKYDQAYRSGRPPGAALLVLAFVPLAAGCGAKQIQAAVDAESAITRTVLRIDVAGDQLTGCVQPATAPQPETCALFNRAMAPAIAAARAYNHAVQRQDVASVSDLVSKLVAVKVALEQLPQSVDRDRLIGELLGVLAQAASGFIGGVQ